MHLRALLSLSVLALLVMTGGCDPQGDCAHEYGTPNATFECRGGRFTVTCLRRHRSDALGRASLHVHVHRARRRHLHVREPG